MLSYAPGTENQILPLLVAEHIVGSFYRPPGSMEKVGYHIKYLKLPYSEKVWWGESLVNLVNRPQFAKLKPSKFVLTINNLLADLLIRQTFFRQMLETSQFAKLSRHQTFPLYSIRNYPGT